MFSKLPCHECELLKVKKVFYKIIINKTMKGVKVDKINSKAFNSIYRHTIGRLLVISRVIGPRLGDVIRVQQAPRDVILVFFADGQAQGGVSVRNGPERFFNPCNVDARQSRQLLRPTT